LSAKLSGRLPRLLVLGTGGTIAGSSSSATSGSYAAGGLSLEAMLGDLAKLDLAADLVPEPIAQIGSQDMSWDVWDKLHKEISFAQSDTDIDGILVAHGTDTAEETAYLLDLTLAADKPLVLVGAMRPAGAVGSDGMRNFANAARVACDPDASGRGPLLVMGDTVFAAKDVRKAATSSIDAFKGFPRGPVARVTPSSLDWFGGATRTGEPARYAWPGALPRVAILTAGAGMDAEPVKALLGIDCKGIVLAGMGQGNAPKCVLNALGEAAKDGIPIVRSARVDEGLVDRNIEVDDDAYGFVAARALGPAKARILLMVLIANGVREMRDIQAAFDRG